MIQKLLCNVYSKAIVSFELKPGLINFLFAFKGSVVEDQKKHLKEFHVVCDGMRPHGVVEEQLN